MRIDVTNLSKIIRGSVILDNISIHFESGHIYGIIGKNGSGKTMLLRAISGLIVPSSGVVYVDGKALGTEISFPPEIGILIEKPEFLGHLSGFENLKMLSEIKGSISDANIAEYMNYFDLDPEEKKPVRKYSQGMKQKLGIIQAIMENQKLLVLDEPFNALDEKSVKLFRELLIEYKKQEKLIILGTANLIGSIIHVNGSKPLGHAVIVNNATGTARNQIYFTAHSPNAKNLNLADEYSGQMVSIRPTYFYDVTTCTGANTSHTFSSTNSKCARCGYVRTYIIPTLLIPMAKNTQITLTARTNHTVSSISMSVKNPNGATTNLGTVTNTNSISKVYTPTVAAHPNDLYTVTVTAVSADGVTTSSTWTFRTY